VQIDGKNNEITCGENISLCGHISGNNNTVTIGPARAISAIKLSINGNNSRIRIGDCYQIKDLHVQCGSHVKAHRTSLEIAGQFSIEPGCSFLLYNSFNRISVGKDCLFSNGITVRCGESPHLIFDLATGEYLDVSDGVSIGNHVWIGERVYINKRTTVPDNTIVAACSVVTKRFDECNTVIGGNPSRVVKRNVQWVRNVDFLERNSIFESGYRRFQNDMAARMDDRIQPA
jgi:acetyltransferase-like isoleucine patch superfamily enzyme